MTASPPTDARREPKARASLLVILFTVMSFAAGELGLRALGHEPFRYSIVDRNEPVTHEPDPALGWRNKPGRYVYPPYVDGVHDIELTVLEDHSRATRRSTAAAAASAAGLRPGLLLVGGSFTRGTAISDRETFAWKLQQRFPDLGVRNLGTGGYGTVQSLLATERALASGDTVQLVVYGYISDHLNRNVATWQWLQNLSRYSRRSHVAVPYATMVDGQLVHHPPQGYPNWPLHEALVTVALAEQVFARLREGDRARSRHEVLDSLLDRMRSGAEAGGAQLLVAVLNATPDDRERVLGVLQEKGIASADCAFPIPLDMVVEGEGVHPNGAMHSRYARCVGDAIESLLSR